MKGSKIDARHLKQTIQTLANQFIDFANKECVQSQSPFYQTLCLKISNDEEVLSQIKNVRTGQKAPNIFLASLQYLILRENPREIVKIYENLEPDQVCIEKDYSQIKDYCFENISEIQTLISDRSAQTNEVQRCAVFLPGIIQAQKDTNQKYHFIDAGCSAGLHLLWHKYYYIYSDGFECGNKESEIRLSCEVKGRKMPHKKNLPMPDSAIGIDINPIRVKKKDDQLWLRAQIWPQHKERTELAKKAIKLAGKESFDIIRGDCKELLPKIIYSIHRKERLIILFCYSVNQMFEFGRDGASELLSDCSKDREIIEISIGYFKKTPEMILAKYRDGEKDIEQVLAACHVHGKWIEWQN